MSWFWYVAGVYCMNYLFFNFLGKGFSGVYIPYVTATRSGSFASRHIARGLWVGVLTYLLFSALKVSGAFNIGVTPSLTNQSILLYIGIAFVGITVFKIAYPLLIFAEDKITNNLVLDAFCKKADNKLLYYGCPELSRDRYAGVACQV